MRMQRKRTLLSILLLVVMVTLLAAPVYAKGKKQKKVKPILSDTAITIAIGQPYQITVQNNVRVKWKTSNKKIASVAGGVVVGKKPGKAVITATGKPGNKKAKCLVVVVPAPVIQTYVLNTNTMKFHLPGCRSVAEILPQNRQDTTESRDQIIARGFVPCKICNP